MLGRVAESIYWIGRYTERVNSHASLINASFHSFREWNGNTELRSEYWIKLLSALDELDNYRNSYAVLDDANALYFRTLDAKHPNSILSCLTNVRHNVRSIRECLPARMWESINDCFLWINQPEAQTALANSPYLFFRKLNDSIALFHGIAGAAMPRRNEWHLLLIGKYIERAENTLRLIKMQYENLKQPEVLPRAAYLQSLATLQAVDGLEIFRRIYADDISPRNVLAFLLLNPHFPLSVYFSFQSLNRHIYQMPAEEPALLTFTGPIHERQQAIILNLTSMGPEIFETDHFLQTITLLLKQCSQLSQTINDTLFRKELQIV